jgi:plastocyanin
MKRCSLAILALALCACESELPKPPVAAAPVAPPPAVAVTTPAAPAPVVTAPIAAVDGGAPAAPVTSAPAPVAASPTTISGTVTLNAKGPAAGAVVYLEGAPVEPTAKMSATMSNKMMKFVPHVVVVPVGGKVAFRNDDPFPHNVNSPDGERFDLWTFPQNEARTHVFNSPGVYSILCSLHPAMLGYVVVAPSSYYAKVDGQGHFSIKDVPSGTYKVTAWAPHQQPSTQPVTASGGETTVNVDVHP